MKEEIVKQKNNINSIDYEAANEQTSLLSSSNQLNSDSKNSQEQTSRGNPSGISWYFAVFLIVNAALGAGLLNFAKAFNNAGGILAATLIHLVKLFWLKIIIFWIVFVF